MEKDPNRKTTIPLKSIPTIVEWLVNNCSKDELDFMADLAGKRASFRLLNSIFTKLTDFNIHEVFYSKFSSSEELNLFRASKRGEVAGLKAFAMACQAARQKIEARKEQSGSSVNP